jgi:hypothetical protein
VEQTTYAVYGLSLASSHPFEIPLPRSGRAPDLEFEVVEGRFREPSGLRRLYTSQYVDAEGRPNTVLDRLGESDVYQFSSAASFVMEPTRITCYLSEEWYRPAIETCLLGPVLSLWLERSGVTALHAAGIVVEGRSLGFVGGNGSGKSTLTTDFLQAGYPLLTDDILPVDCDGDTWRGRPGYPQMRMRPEQARRVVEEADALEIVLPWVDKRRVPIGPDGFGSFWPDPAPLAALYIPERHPDVQDVVIRPIPSTEALATLYGHAFAAPVLDVTVPAAARLQRVARLTRNVPIRHLLYPDGYEHLVSVREALLDDLAQTAAWPAALAVSAAETVDGTREPDQRHHHATPPGTQSTPEE